MIDHISVRAQDFAKIVDFYKAALAPIGYKVLMEFPNTAGMGADGKPDLWIMQSDKPINPTHLAISGLRPQIDEFYSAALSADGSDNGPPGLRADYHPNYYAAFVHDPEGNNIEVVCHFPDGIDPATVKPAAKKSSARSKKPAVKAKAKAMASSKARKPAAKKPAAKKAAKKPAAKAKAKGKKRR